MLSEFTLEGHAVRLEPLSLDHAEGLAKAAAGDRDSYGYTWLISNHMSDETDTLVTDLHAVNSALVDNGFGPQLLCTMVAFADEDHRRMALVYLYKRGTFYPFAPVSESRQQRDNALELQVKGVLSEDLKIEPDLTKWMALWGAPGL